MTTGQVRGREDRRQRDGRLAVVLLSTAWTNTEQHSPCPAASGRSARCLCTRRAGAASCRARPVCPCPGRRVRSKSSANRRNRWRISPWTPPWSSRPFRTPFFRRRCWLTCATDCWAMGLALRSSRCTRRDRNKESLPRQKDGNENRRITQTEHVRNTERSPWYPAVCVHCAVCAFGASALSF